MNPRRKKRLTIVIAVIAAIGVITGLVLYALSQNIDLFYTPSEIINGKDDTGLKPVIGQRIRVGGLVVPGTVMRDPNNLKVQFDLTNQGETIRVKYDGILPDLFREGQGIVAQGMMDESGVFQASEVLAKHDENYMPPEVADALEKAGKMPKPEAEVFNK